MWHGNMSNRAPVGMGAPRPMPTAKPNLPAPEQGRQGSHASDPVRQGTKSSGARPAQADPSSPLVNLSKLPSAALTMSAVDAYLSLHPEPFSVKSADDLRNAGKQKASEWLSWFVARPDVSLYLKERQKLNEAIAIETNALVKQLVATANLQAAQEWVKQSAPVASVRAQLRASLEKACVEFQPLLQKTVFEYSKKLNTNQDIGWGSSEKWQSQPWSSAGFAKNQLGQPAADLSDIPAQYSNAVTPVVLSMPVLQLPEVAGTDAQASKVALSGSALSSALSAGGSPGPGLQQLLAFLNSCDAKGQTPPMYKPAADYFAGKIAPLMQGLFVAASLEGNTPFSIATVKNAIEKGLQPWADEYAAQVAAAQTKRLSVTPHVEKMVLTLPEGFIRNQAAAIGNQVALLAVAKAQVQAGEYAAMCAADTLSQSMFLKQYADAAVNLQMTLPAFDSFNEALNNLVLAACNYGDALTKAGKDQAEEAGRQADQAKANTSMVADLINATGVAAVRESDVAATAKDSEGLKDKAKDLLKLAQNLAAGWKLTRANSNAALSGNTLTPSPTSVVPAQIDVSGGTITLNGSFFANNVEVTVGGKSAVVTYVSPAELRVEAPPADQPGKVDVVVTNQGVPANPGDTPPPSKSATLTEALEYTQSSSGSGILWWVAAAVALKYSLSL